MGVGLSKKPKVWTNLESGCGWMLDYNVSSGPISNGLRFESLFYQLSKVTGWWLVECWIVTSALVLFSESSSFSVDQDLDLSLTILIFV